jgi:arginase
MLDIMRAIHFFKAYSRIGMAHIPIHGTSLNIGVEEGPNAIFSPSFCSENGLHTFDDFIFSRPEEFDKNQIFSEFRKESENFALLINEKLQVTNGLQVVVGGDHSVAYASLLAIVHRYSPNDIGFIQIDSHADINNLSSSPTGNIHGMYLRPFLDKFDCLELEIPAALRLSPKQVLYIGNLELDPDEARFISSHNIPVITQQKIQTDPNGTTVLIKEYVRCFKHLHISFDIDVFDQSLVTATGTPSIDGLFAQDVFPLLKLVSQHPDISIDLVEVNPFKSGAVETIALAQNILIELLAKHKEYLKHAEDLKITPIDKEIAKKYSK